MDPRTFADTISKVADKCNLSTDDLPILIKKIIAISMKYISKEDLWNTLFTQTTFSPGETESDKPYLTTTIDFVDWNIVQQHSRENLLGGMIPWMQLLDMMSWNHLEKHETEIYTKQPILVSLRKHLRDVSLDPGEAEGWSMACKVKLIMMLNALPTAESLDIFTCNVFKRPTTQACLQFLSKQADLLYTPEQQLSVIAYILLEAKVSTDMLKKNMEISKVMRDENKFNLKLKRMQVVQGRPRLRDKLATHTLSEATTAATWETYTGFCYKHQFPPTLSETIKTRLYFLASQTRWDWQKHLDKIAINSDIICKRVASYPVNQPDVPVLIRVIESLSMDGRHPFGQLNVFRARCFQGFPVTQVQKLSLTQILHLYLSVYQTPWKELWKHFIGVISVQIIRDCEQFVRDTPIDELGVMEILAGKLLD